MGGRRQTGGLALDVERAHYSCGSKAMMADSRMTKIVTCAAPIAAALFKTELTSLFKQAAIFATALSALIEISSPLRAVEAARAPPSGPAAQAILRWFTTDRSLGCGDDACTVEGIMGLCLRSITAIRPVAARPYVLAFVYYNPFGGSDTMDVRFGLFSSY